MRRDAFINWLTDQGQKKSSTAAARASNCATVERSYKNKDLDTMSKNEFSQLLEKFEYSKVDERAGSPKRHEVSINGDLYNGTATLRGALKLYYNFRFHPDADPPKPSSAPDAAPRSPVVGAWPQWEAPSEDDSLLLAMVLARHARFLKPEVVRAVVEDNNRRAADWHRELIARGIPAAAYLWEDSPCAFPGVRRYSGSDEIAIFRGRKQGDGKLPKDALTLDDNDYPKHLWSHLYLGKPFPKHGPKGYNLAHLADHKDHNNRAAEDFKLVEGASVDGKLHGLFTCPTNTVYLPVGLLKPTDFHAKVRHLFIRKAQALYGDFCNIVPPFLTVPKCSDEDWQIDKLEWADPVGDLTHMDLFLTFRAKKMEELLKQSPSHAADLAQVA